MGTIRRVADRPLVAGVEAPLTITVPVDPVVGPGVNELMAVSIARAAAVDLELVVMARSQVPDLAASMEARCRSLAEAGAPAVRWRELPPGRIAEAIVDYAEGPGPMVLCMALASRHATTSMLVSSVTEEVLRRSTVPVLVAGPHLGELPDRYDQVVVASEGSQGARGALAAGTALASLVGAEIRVVRVDHPVPPPSAPDPHRSGRPADRGRAPEVISSPDPAGAILDAVAGRLRTILAMGCHKLGGQLRFALGPVTLDVVRRARCPVLVVPPAAAHRVLTGPPRARWTRPARDGPSPLVWAGGLSEAGGRGPGGRSAVTPGPRTGEHPMPIIDALRRPGISIEADQTIRQAARLMEQTGVGALAVVDGGQLVGIVTDRDLVQRAVAPGLDLGGRVDAVMSMPVDSIEAGDDLHDAVRAPGPCPDRP